MSKVAFDHKSENVADRLKYDDELAAMAVNTNTLLPVLENTENIQKNGPAEAATSPSHGSTNPDQERAVNVEDTTTRKADEPVTVEQLAAMIFEPWDRAAELEDPKSPPSNSEWMAIGESNLPLMRLAHEAMFKTKGELICLLENDRELMGRFMMDLSSVIDLLRNIGQYAEVIDAAQVRMACAFASIEMQAATQAARSPQ